MECNVRKVGKYPGTTKKLNITLPKMYSRPDITVQMLQQVPKLYDIMTFTTLKDIFPNKFPLTML